MFASTLESIGYCTKKIPTLTTREPSVVRTIRYPPSHVTYFQAAYESVRAIRKLLAKIHSFRVEVLPRDVEDIFNHQQQFCEFVLGHSNHKAMFEFYDKDSDQKLNEDEQISIFTRLLVILYNKKEELLQGQWYKQHQNLLQVIKQVEEEVPLIEKLIRERIADVKLEYVARRKRKALSEYEVEAQKSQKQFAKDKEQWMCILRRRQQEQAKKLEYYLDDSNPERVYKARPSSILREVKDLTLLEKLSPYRHEKKRAYQCNQLNKTIADSITVQQDRIDKSIEVHKNLQRRRLRQHQRIKLKIEQDRYQQKQKELLMSIQQERQRIDQGETNKSQTLMLNDKREAIHRINWLGKATKAQHSRADSLNIARIVMQHRDVLQFNSSIEKLTTLASNQGADSVRDYRYFGSDALETTRRLLTNSNRTPLLSPRQLQTTLTKRTPIRQAEDLSKYQDLPTLNPNPSLTDLYDHSLNLIKR